MNHEELEAEFDAMINEIQLDDDSVMSEEDKKECHEAMAYLLTLGS